MFTGAPIQITPHLNLRRNKGRLDIIKYILEECDVEKNSETTATRAAIKEVVCHGHLQTLKYLVEDRKFDVAASYAYDYACFFGHSEIIEYLVTHGCKQYASFKNFHWELNPLGDAVGLDYTSSGDTPVTTDD
jgi:hypothetical protein